MNILKNLLFSYKGKIGRADYIYGIVYITLLVIVSLDAFIHPTSVFLIGGGIDYAEMLIYMGSIVGLFFAAWSYCAVVSKRARALNIEIRWIIFGIVFPPLLLLGLMTDSEKYVYHSWLSLLDRIFFVLLIAIMGVCLLALYDVKITVKFALFFALFIGGLSIYLFWRDKHPYHNHPKIKYVWIDSWIDLLFVLLIVFFVRGFVISPFQIIGPSMESTFHGGQMTYTGGKTKYSDGEFILVDKMTYRLGAPKRGDVVVFTPGIYSVRNAKWLFWMIMGRFSPKDYLIKRVIGLPGDTVKIENGYVFIATKDNPEKFIRLDESEYLEEKFGYTCIDYSSMGCDREWKIFKVPEDRYFLMGDNRPQSLDARKCFNNKGGCVGEYTSAQYVGLSHIQGRVAYSLGHFDAFSQLLPYPKLGTIKQIVPFRGLDIKNYHIYSELTTQ